MKRFTTILVPLALLLCVCACNRGNDKGCKVEDQCGRTLEQGSNPGCTEVRCVPNACDATHMTMLGHKICDKGAVVVPNASAK